MIQVYEGNGVDAEREYFAAKESRYADGLCIIGLLDEFNLRIETSQWGSFPIDARGFGTYQEDCHVTISMFRLSLNKAREAVNNDTLIHLDVILNLLQPFKGHGDRLIHAHVLDLIHIINQITTGSPYTSGAGYQVDDDE